MSVYHTVHTSSGPFVIAFPCYFFQCPRAKVPYSCILGYGRPVPSSLQILHSVLLNQHYQSHHSRTSSWSSLSETNTSSVHDALTFYLLGNLWLLYLELFAHNNPDILTAHSVASTPRLSVLPSRVDRLLVLLICLCILRLLFLNCSLVLHLFLLVDS